MGRNCVLEALNFTKLCVPHSEMLSRLELTAKDIEVRDSVRASEVGWEAKVEEM